ncbi:MAG: DUF1015 domain-containing protein [Fidelibacterota bacterium]|nr:MAG: DUF1015 domain-containing protein [Candidatus Neomarinimicrobiota bacterium]
MANIHPFPAILYRSDTESDVTPRVAPPYDVIDPALEVTLRERNPYNIVRLILPEGSSGGSPYETASGLFRDWMGAGILYREDKPAMYVWEQEFNHDGTTYRRRALVAKVTCEPYRPGGVMRHEHTHSGPKEDRLKLFQATGAQFSQIFGIFDDEQGEVAAILARLAGGTEQLAATGDDGHVSRLLGTTDNETIQGLQDYLAGCTITIADGHHRYETSVAYYKGLNRQGTTLMTLVPSGDPGLVVLPTHRTIELPLDEQAFSQALAAKFSVEVLPLESWPGLYQESAHHPESGIILAVAPTIDKVFKIGWHEKSAVSTGPESSDRQLGDVVILHEYVLPAISKVFSEDTQHFGYYHDAGEAVEAARANGRWAFLLRPTSTQMLLWAAEHQVVLPPKSTYFYPKFLSGFINAYLD